MGVVCRRRRARAHPVGPSAAARSATTLLHVQVTAWPAEDAEPGRFRFLYILKDLLVHCRDCGRPGRGLVCMRCAQADDWRLAETGAWQGATPALLCVSIL